jgi:undecaprenyl-diphosphatase
LGVIQGVTEFLPVSSSGHLVIAQYLLGINSPGNTLEILFHFGTLLSVIFVFFNEIKLILISLHERNTQIIVCYLIIATIPAVFVGIGLKDYLLDIFDSVKYVGLALLFTGSVLILSSKFKHSQKKHSFFSSLAIGLAQALAIIPGISRSGLTISMSIFLGIAPKEAAKFSFLLSIPIILGASLLGVFELENDGMIDSLTIFVAIFTSFIIGILALKFLLKMLEVGKFHFFGVYCLGAGIFAIFL